MSERVTTWVDGYRRAWLSNDPDDIRALFTDDALYERRPNDPKPDRGIDAIVTSWLDGADAPDETTWEWHPLAEEANLATIQGRTVYRGEGDDPETIYDNLWELRIAPDGLVSHFTESYNEPEGHS